MYDNFSKVCLFVSRLCHTGHQYTMHDPLQLVGQVRSYGCWVETSGAHESAVYYKEGDEGSECIR